MSLIEKEVLRETNYLKLPTDELLDAFGRGNHIPGSGSAAILSALLGIEMMRTVIKLTLSKDEYKKDHNSFRYILNDLENNQKEKLSKLFNKDIEEFHKVSFHRRKRDLAKQTGDEVERIRHSEMVNEQLKICTEIPFEAVRVSLTLLDYAFTIFDNGFRSARGDSGVAISNILSSFQGSLFVGYLNLKSLKKSKWKSDLMKEAVEFTRRFTELQKKSFERVVNLYNDIEGEPKQLSITFPEENK